MFGAEYYHETIRRYVIVFGTMFNDMVVWRRNTAGDIVKRIKVPIAYGPRAKFLSRLRQDPNITKADAISLPRMSFQIAGYNYDPMRKLPTAGQIKSPAANSEVNAAIYNPVPYNIDFELSIYVLNAEDGTQLLEQILPYFTPEWTNTMKLVDDLDLRMDVPVVLNNVITEDTYEDSYENRRTIIHTLNFTMKGYMFGPVRNRAVINTANTRTFVIDGFSANLATSSNLAVESGEIASNATLSNTLFFTTTKVQPGLDANGDPTTNLQLTIPPDQIASNDNWAFIVTTNTNPDFPVDDPTNDPDT